MKLRKEQVVPVFEDFYNWLQSKVNTISPECKVGKAINYTLNEWNKLIKYVDHYFLTPDNNATEQAIRPFVLGRKNWLFSNTPKGADASAVIYSLVESAKANNLEPYHYLRYLFTNLPMANSREDLKKLLPNKVSADQLKIN